MLQGLLRFDVDDMDISHLCTMFSWNLQMAMIDFNILARNSREDLIEMGNWMIAVMVLI